MMLEMNSFNGAFDGVVHEGSDVLRQQAGYNCEGNPWTERDRMEGAKGAETSIAFIISGKESKPTT